ncbi:MAG: ATP-dependent zinc metalloprotease FtsH [Thermodesulfobacteriota bacterium]
MNRSKRSPLSYLPLVLWLLLAVALLGRPIFAGRELSYSEFKAALDAGRVEEVAVSPSVITGVLEPEAGRDGGPPSGQRFETVRVEDPDLMRQLAAHGVRVRGVRDAGVLATLLTWLAPLLLVVAAWALLMRRPGAGRGGLLAIGQSKAKVYLEKEVDVSFADVAGVDEAKEELREVVEFLKTPEKFRRLGGKIPKGLLLVGPPGTGKTLLARAVAGEAGVPFFSISGSEFVEMFVGVGASRVRDLFEQARAKAPCIVFIDELDALGKARGIGPMAHEEREQTLNQLLVEMDGFDPRSGVILMAATNRPEILDPALLRAGRFDRHVLVDRPDKAGRRAILEVHARGVVLASKDDLDVVAGMTTGFAGADLANVVNEAALLAARRGKDAVTLAELQEAVERIVGGLEKKNRVLNPAERERVAHHEVGHALTSLAIPGSDVVQKISIVPRGIAALGYTLQLPTEDRFLMTRTELSNKIAVLLGGRVAEELVYGEVSTGAQDDLRKATEIAKSMVRVYGMSDKLGGVSFQSEPMPVFLEAPQRPPGGDYSDATARQIDREVRRILDEQYARVRGILAERAGILRRAAALLLERETISGDDLRAIAGREAAVAPRIAAASGRAAGTQVA